MFYFSFRAKGSFVHIIQFRSELGQAARYVGLWHISDSLRGPEESPLPKAKRTFSAKVNIGGLLPKSSCFARILTWTGTGSC